MNTKSKEGEGWLRLNGGGHIPYKFNKDTSLYECPECPKNFNTMESYRYHYKFKHIAGPVYKCQCCGYSCHNKNLMVRHLVTKHNIVKELICVTCMQDFPNLEAKYDHQKLIHGAHYKGNYRCTYCPFITDKRYNIKTHIQQTHFKKKNLMCGECGFTCFNNTLLRKHVLSKHAPNSMTCRYCNFQSHNPQSLKMHEEVSYLN